MTSSSAPVTSPEALLGPVRRSLYLDVDGHRDDTTTVIWFQGPSRYVDLRRPAALTVGTDVTDVKGLADLSRPADLATAAPSVLHWLGAHEGFAGTFRVTGDQACWERLVDVHPPTGVPDEGRLSWDGETLVETGVHRAYVEHWHPEPAPPTDAAAVQLLEVGTGRPGILVRVGGRFGVARGRTTPLPPGPPLTDRLLAADPHDRAALLDCEVALGRVDPDGRWVVELSTLPYREGADLAPRDDGDLLTTQDVDLDGLLTRTWQVVAREGAAALVPPGPPQPHETSTMAGDLDAAQ